MQTRPANTVLLALAGLFALLCLPTATVAAGNGNLPAQAAQAAAADQAPKPIPWSQIGAKAGADYQGEGLKVTATAEGARLLCVFQRLNGEATPEGLWLTSTTGAAKGERFRVVASAVGRKQSYVWSDMGIVSRPQSDLAPSGAAWREGEASWCDLPLVTELEATVLDHPYRHGAPNGAVPSFMLAGQTLARVGRVEVDGQVARFIRPGLTEEYSVSMDGVRQDFVIEQSPAGEGPLRLELDVAGAKAEPLLKGARFVLDGSRRKLVYNRLRVADAKGRELAARLQVTASNRIAVVVDDANAVYPVRIDPSFSDEDWVSLNVLPGASGAVYAVAADGGGNVYVAGAFVFIGKERISRIAKWDGSTWSALGQGVNADVLALAVSGTNIYAAGAFSTAGGVPANRIAKWDGTTWSALGAGITGYEYDPINGYYCYVYALALRGNDLYVGGAFTGAGGVSANRIAKWDGSTWSALGAGTDRQVRALAVSGTVLYAGGGFTNAGGVGANYVAKWDGSTWSTVGAGMNNRVYALAVNGTDLFAGGDFTMAGTVSAHHIAKWNGSAWSALGSGMDSAVGALAADGANLYAGGTFTTAGGVAAANIAKWDGNVWSSLGSGTGDWVNALAVSGTNLYVGGDFDSAGGTRADFIAKWSGSSWSALGHGIVGWPDYYGVGVYAFALSGSDLYLGGFFTTFGTVTATSIVKWDGSDWSALGAGLSSDDPYYPHPWVNALAVNGTNLYVAGYFTKAGSVVVNNIAKWNGSAWSALGAGIGHYIPDYYLDVFALAVSGTNLYAGGTFATAGGVAATSIAKWNGDAWSALGTGLSRDDPDLFPYVYALAVAGTNLYVGGYFTTAGGVTVNNIAKWDGSNWSALGSGMEGTPPDVTALAVAGTNLYAGGSFTNAGGVSANYIAKWDGKAWSALAAGLRSGVWNPGVKTLALSGNDVYAGGDFLVAGDYAASRIAKWDGTEWWDLGSGVGDPVRALALDGAGHLFVGGEFWYAGVNPSPFFAQANIALLGGRFTSPAFSTGTGYRFTFGDGSIGRLYRIQTSPSLTNGGWNDFTNFIYTGPIVIRDTSSITSTQKFYRAITP
jgi:hypothetical protein